MNDIVKIECLVRYLGGELYADGSWRTRCGVPGAWEAAFRVTWDEAEKRHDSSTLVSVASEEPDSGPLEAELRYAETLSGYAQSREDYLAAMEDAHDPS